MIWKAIVLRKKQILIKVFGTEDTRVKTVDIVPLKYTSSIKTIVIEAICTPTNFSHVLNEDVKTLMKT